ncbi:hypothetical protein [Thiohalocapsa sp. ML1]|uniref:hypothetical protein n=1 Tax=Thiohalocapsa sp. ML1 TaxID=1431688 RepID=UPI000731FFF2|nr:hypothetical protein [Thiohalocapsa sp. ML1]
MLPDRYRLRRRLDALPAALGYGLGLLAAAAVLALVWRLPGGWGLTTSLLLGGATAALAFRLGLQPRVSGQDWTPQALPPAAPPRPVEPAAAAAVAGPVAADEPEPSPESAPLLPWWRCPAANSGWAPTRRWIPLPTTTSCRGIGCASARSASAASR